MRVVRRRDGTTHGCVRPCRLAKQRPSAYCKRRCRLHILAAMRGSAGRSMARSELSGVPELPHRPVAAPWEKAGTSDLRHKAGLALEDAILRPAGPQCPALARNPGTSAAAPGGVAVGGGWVYCFLSRREGDQRKCWEPEAANPLNFQGQDLVGVLCAAGSGGLVWLLVWSWKRDLHRGLEPGKFEKLLRSDP